MTARRPRSRPEPAPGSSTGQALRARIWHLVKQHDPTITRREQVALAVRVATSLELLPDNYGRIVKYSALKGRACRWHAASRVHAHDGKHPQP